jgi:hypothetical protein
LDLRHHSRSPGWFRAWSARRSGGSWRLDSCTIALPLCQISRSEWTREPWEVVKLTPIGNRHAIRLNPVLSLGHCEKGGGSHDTGPEEHRDRRKGVSMSDRWVVGVQAIYCIATPRTVSLVCQSGYMYPDTAIAPGERGNSHPSLNGCINETSE